VVIDHEKFWDWARKMSKNNIVVISEYKAPKDFHCFKKIGKGKTNAGKESKGNEKLFIFS
jgi:hypothetical protein